MTDFDTVFEKTMCDLIVCSVDTELTDPSDISELLTKEATSLATDFINKITESVDKEQQAIAFSRYTGQPIPVIMAGMVRASEEDFLAWVIKLTSELLVSTLSEESIARSVMEIKSL